jgi:hypothetical protein
MTDETVRERAIEAYESARDNFAASGRKARDTLSEAPLLALAGGIAAGAIIAALLPRTKRETELVGPTAKRVRDSARAAYDAARDAGSSKLDEAGITRDRGTKTMKDLIQGLTDAARASAGAAYDAARAKE